MVKDNLAVLSTFIFVYAKGKNVVDYNINFLSIKEFASKVGVHHCTIRRAITSGKIISIKIGGVYRIPFGEIERILTETLDKTVERILEKRSS